MTKMTTIHRGGAHRLPILSVLVLLGMTAPFGWGCQQESPAGKAVNDVEKRLSDAEKHLEESGDALSDATGKLGALEEAIEELKEACVQTDEPVRFGLAPEEGDPERCLTAQGAVLSCDRSATWLVARAERPDDDDDGDGAQAAEASSGGAGESGSGGGSGDSGDDGQGGGLKQPAKQAAEG
ncbi:MAG TPA: hypothetical protein RMF84_16445 [Polyangiaceae bacterium LLY-WYZ-14_1]|nr:hypothetical protein [Polyangiaceae bacterium LLY-WYZ-14_1]